MYPRPLALSCLTPAHHLQAPEWPSKSEIYKSIVGDPIFVQYSMRRNRRETHKWRERKRERERGFDASSQAFIIPQLLSRHLGTRPQKYTRKVKRGWTPALNRSQGPPSRPQQLLYTTGANALHDSHRFANVSPGFYRDAAQYVRAFPPIFPMLPPLVTLAKASAPSPWRSSRFGR